MKTGFNGKKREWCLLIAMGLAASVAESVATYPDMPYAGPSSMPDLPAVFTDYNPPVDSDPVNANTPAVAEWTRSNRPGDTMALTGETLSIHSGVAEGRDTKFVFYGGEATPANGLIQRLDGAQCALTLPDTLLASEMYLMWPHNENGSGNPIAINQTEAWWVGPDHAARGETFSVYGRNLVLGEGSCHLYVEGHGWLVSTTADPYKADFEVPSDLANGTYTLWAHNGCGGKYGWAKPLSLTVDSVVDWSKGDIIDVTKAPYNAAGDGATDDHGAIQAACEAAGSGDTVYFPAGTYLSSYDLFPPNGARILGDGMDSTIIQPHPNNSRSQFVRASDDSFFKDITFASDDNNMKFWYGGGSQRVTWENVRFDQRANRAEHDTCLYFPTADHLVFKNCEFYQSDNMWFEEASQIFFDGCKFVGLNDLNTYITSSAKELSLANSTCANYDESDTTNAYGWAIGRWIVGQGHGTDKNPMLTYFGGNTMTNLGPRFAAARFVGKIDSISGTQATCSELVGFSGYLNPATMKVRREGPYTWQEASISSIDTSTGTITLTRDWGSAWYPGSKVGDTIEICDYVDANSGEIFMTESLPAVVRSTPVSATANTITFSSTPSGLSGHVVAIVDGKGMGQTRRIIAHTGTTLTLDEDWNVVPNAESLAIVGECSYRMVAYGNHFDGNPDAAHIAKRFVGNPAVQPYGMANDWIVDSNIMTDLRIGIADYLWMDDSIDSYYDVTPNYFNYYANNTISNCYHGIWRNLRLHNAANIHEDIHEVGTMFRNNTIVDSVHRAIDHEQLSTSATIPGNVVFLTVLDGNTVASNTDFFYGRDGFFNQVWIGNEFVSSNGGVGLSRLNESSVLRGNAWSGFESNYGEGPGALLGLPAKVVDTSAAGIPVLNCGTDPLTWSASTDAAWMTLTASSGSVLDENSMGMLTFEVDASAVPAENPQAVITVLDDAGQEQQVTVEYVAEATVPPPPDPPPSPVLMGISVSGPAGMDEKTTAQYVCTASYSDGSTATAQATWSEDSTDATINSAGALSVGDIDADQVITITASYSGKTDSFAVSVADIPVVLTGIAISGPSSVDEETTAQYTCTASYSDGTSAVVVPTWSENSSYASISGSGLLSTGNVASDQNVTVSASFDGMTDTHAVTVSYVPPVLTGITISGPSAMNEETAAQYTCTATYSDGTSATVVPTWSENSSYASISGSGLLSAGNVASDQSVTVSASFGGKTDTHAVMVSYVPPVLTGITISGASSVDEETTAQYTCTAIYSDGTSAVVSPTWSESSSYTTISTSGVLAAGNVTSDQSVTVSASFGGKTDTHAVTINHVVALTSLVITGPDSIKENATAQYTCTAHYSDGSSAAVNPVWSDDSVFVSVDNAGNLTSGNVSTDVQATVYASFAGEVASKMLLISVVGNQVVFPLSGFEGKTVSAELWDEVTQTMTPLGEEFEPEEIVIENVNSNQWYWLGLREYDSATEEWVLVLGRWLWM